MALTVLTSHFIQDALYASLMNHNKIILLIKTLKRLMKGLLKNKHNIFRQIRFLQKSILIIDVDIKCAKL